VSTSAVEVEKSTGRRRWHLSAAGIAGLVAFITGVVTLIFTLSPSLKPDPGNAISAKLDVIGIEPATFKDYQRRLGDAAPKPLETDPQALKRRGFVVYLGVEVNGRKRRDIELLQATYDARTHRRLYPAERSLTFRSDTPSDRWVAPLFVIPPAIDGQFFQRYELYDRNVILAIADTPRRRGQGTG
jgi:hypothetical protein